VRMRMHMHTTHTSARAQTRMHPGTRGPDHARTHASAHEHAGMATPLKWHTTIPRLCCSYQLNTPPPSKTRVCLRIPPSMRLYRSLCPQRRLADLLNKRSLGFNNMVLSIMVSKHVCLFLAKTPPRVRFCRPESLFALLFQHVGL